MSHISHAARYCSHTVHISIMIALYESCTCLSAINISWCFSPLPHFFFQFATLAPALTLVSQVPPSNCHARTRTAVYALTLSLVIIVFHPFVSVCWSCSHTHPQIGDIFCSLKTVSDRVWDKGRETKSKGKENRFMLRATEGSSIMTRRKHYQAENLSSASTHMLCREFSAAAWPWATLCEGLAQGPWGRNEDGEITGEKWSECTRDKDAKSEQSTGALNCRATRFHLIQNICFGTLQQKHRIWGPQDEWDVSCQSTSSFGGEYSQIGSNPLIHSQYGACEAPKCFTLLEIINTNITI